MSADRPRTRTRGSEPAASKRRHEIIALAADLFDVDGYYRTPMEAIADRAGLAKPSLYHYFGGKEEILFEIHQQFIALLFARHEARDGSVTAREELLGVMEDFLEFIHTHRGFMRVFFELYRGVSDERLAVVQQARDRYRSMVEGVIERGQKADEFRHIDPRLAAMALFGTCNWAYQWSDHLARATGGLPPRELAGVLFDMVLNGLTSDRRSPVANAC
jgi:AcrR family transcriptional regulator